MFAVGRVPFPTDGPQLHARAGGVPGRGAHLARSATSRRPPAELRHRRGLRAATASGSARSATTAGRRCRWPIEYGGRGAGILEVADLRGGVLPRRRARARQPERHLPARPHDAWSSAPTSRRRASSRRWRRRRDLGAGVVRARRRQRPGRHPQPRGVLSDDGAEWILNGQKIWASRGAFGRLVLRHLPHRPRGRAPPRPRRSSSCRSTRPASPCARSRSSTARPASPRSSSTTSRVPVENTLGDVGRGWCVAMATAGFERGLSLRSPARFTEAADRLVEL